MRREWLTQFLAIVVLAGCQQYEVDGVREPGATDPEVTERKVEVLEQNASAEGDQSAPSASETIKMPEAQAVDPVGKDPMDDAITCLARSIYWEARGEETVSMEAVANVVMNRLRHDGFPNTVCEVVMQGREQGACQFSWWCDGRSDQANEDEPYATAKEISRRALNLQLTDLTEGALYFHQRTVSPSWAMEYVKTIEIGEFLFYKPRGSDAK